jgi:hypothetical protein
MKLSFRIIGKLLFLLVIIGFFMPMACDANGFQLAQSDHVKSSLVFALYLLFFSAVVGLIIGVLLILKKKMPVFIDWIIVLVCLCSGLIPFFLNLRKADFQSGVYVILTGYALILLAQIVSLVKKKT